MNVRFVLLFLTICLAAPFCDVHGQTNLTGLLSYALQHSRDVRKAELQQKEAVYLHRETLGKGLPQADLSASYTRMFYDFEVSQELYDLVDAKVSEENKEMMTGMLHQLDEVSGIDMASATFQVTQLLYSQSYLVGLKTTQKTRELYSILKNKTDEEVIAEVASGYYQAGSLLLQLQTVNKSIKNLNEIHHIADLSYRNDLIKESQVNRLKVTITNLEVTRRTIENGIDIQLNYLKALAGMPSDTVISIDTTMLIRDFIQKEAAGDFNITNVPSYQALLKQDEICSQEVKLAKAKYLPTLAAFGQFSFSHYKMDPLMNSDNNRTTAGLSLTMPLFSSGSNYYKIKQVQLKQARVKEDILKTSDLLTVNYTNAYLEYNTAADMLRVQEENRELARKVYDQTSMQYREGMASMADLLNVNSDFLQADNSYNQQILKCKISEIKMLQASGKLKESMGIR